MNSLNSADTERAFYINYINHTQINTPHNSILLLENTHLFETPPFPSFLILYADIQLWCFCALGAFTKYVQLQLTEEKQIYIYIFNNNNSYLILLL